jgi:hypothetical protein
MRKYIILALLVLCLGLFPVFASTDLIAYTTAGNYVTPAYGYYLGGDYYYSHDNIEWYINTIENFEANGYYSVFDTNNPVIHVTGTMKAGLTGNILVCAGTNIFSSLNCQTIGKYTNVGNEQSFVGDYNLLTNGIAAGKFHYWVRINYDIGGSATSWEYSGYYNIEEAWKQKRIITITSTSNLSGGVITLTLNSSQTAELNAIDITYDNDGIEQTLSGTLSNLLFVNAEETKAYPYYIENYKGGFYNYSRNTSNTTVIKIFINENTTTKGLIMLANYSSANSYDGYYNFTGREDDNNNPFVIYQVFSDWRWNESFGNLTIVSSTKGRIIRNISITGQNTYEINPKFISNVSLINLRAQSSTSYPVINFIFGDWQFASYSITPVSFVLLNSSGSTISTTSTSGDYPSSTYKILNGNLTYTSSSTSGLTILESKLRIGNISRIGLASGNAGQNATLWFYRDLLNISSTNTISNTTNTSFISGSIGINPNTPTKSNINIIPIKIDLVAYDSGYVNCYLDNGNFIDSIDIPENNTGNTYNLIMNYIDSDQTHFYNNSTSSYSYYCSFYSGGHNISTQPYYTILSDKRIYLSNMFPPTYHYLTSLPPESINQSFPPALNFPAYTDTLNFDYGFDNRSLNGTRLYSYFYKLTNCDVMYNNKCIKFNENNKELRDQANGVCITDPTRNTGCGYIYCIPGSDFQVNPVNYSYLTKCMEYQTCYLQEKKIFIISENFTNTINQIVCYNTTNINQSNFTNIQDGCIIGTCPSNNSVICNYPVMTYGNWLINQSANCTFNKQKGEPLKYFGSVIYQTQILGRDEIGDFVYGAIFSLVFNFWFVVVAIGIASLMAWREIYLSGILMLFSAYIFSYLGWLGLLTPTLLTVLVVLGCFIWMVRQH